MTFLRKLNLNRSPHLTIFISKSTFTCWALCRMSLYMHHTSTSPPWSTVLCILHVFIALTVLPKFLENLLILIIEIHASYLNFSIMDHSALILWHRTIYMSYFKNLTDKEISTQVLMLHGHGKGLNRKEYPSFPPISKYRYLRT